VKKIFVWWHGRENQLTLGFPYSTLTTQVSSMTSKDGGISPHQWASSWFCRDTSWLSSDPVHFWYCPPEDGIRSHREDSVPRLCPPFLMPVTDFFYLCFWLTSYKLEFPQSPPQARLLCFISSQNLGKHVVKDITKESVKRRTVWGRYTVGEIELPHPLPNTTF
jgi:hypothetical protein